MMFDYSLCNQTVTLYRFRNGKVHRQIIENGFYTWQVEMVSDETGTRQETLCTLILPGRHDLLPGDRVYDGIGPQITQWPGFVPAAVYGLAELNYVRPCTWQGEICHTEAGRK